MQLLLPSRYLVLKIQFFFTSLACKSSQNTASVLNEWCDGDRWTLGNWCNEVIPSLSLSTWFRTSLLIKCKQTWKIRMGTDGQWPSYWGRHHGCCSWHGHTKLVWSQPTSLASESLSLTQIFMVFSSSWSCSHFHLTSLLVTVPFGGWLAIL